MIPGGVGAQGFGSQAPAPILTPPEALQSAALSSSHSGPLSSGTQQRMSAVGGVVGQGLGKHVAVPMFRAALRRTLIGGRLLALGPLIAREAALHVALILGVAGHLVLEHVLPLIVADLHHLPARINAEGLIAPVLGATEAGATGPGRGRGEAPDPHTCDADAVGRVGLEIARTHARSEERRVGKECRSRWSTDH